MPSGPNMESERDQGKRQYKSLFPGIIHFTNTRNSTITRIPHKHRSLVNSHHLSTHSTPYKKEFSLEPHLFIKHPTPAAGQPVSTKMDVMAILGRKVQSTEAPDLEQQNQHTNRLLLRESEWRESLVNPQCMINNPEPTRNSMPLQHDDRHDDMSK